MTWYLNLSYTMELIVAVLFSLGLTLFLMVVMERWVAYDVRVEHNDLTSFIFGSLGIFSALIISTLFVMAMEHFNSAQQSINNEAEILTNLHRNAWLFSPQMGREIDQRIVVYARTVSEVGWKHEQFHTQDRALKALSLSIAHYTPETIKQIDQYYKVVSYLNGLYDAQRQRQGQIATSIAPQLYVVLFVIQVITLMFSFLYGSGRRGMQGGLISLLAVAIGVTYSLIITFDTPFSGDFCVSNQPYLDLISLIQGGSQ